MLPGLRASFRMAAVPNPGRDAPAELTNKVDLVLGVVAWAGTAAGVAGVLVVGAMMAISVKRGESSEHMSRLGMVLGGCVLVSTAGPLINFVFT
jgi:ribose/xylose/arabinose/galactoside ABC-type transport system permease subunit